MIEKCKAFVRKINQSGLRMQMAFLIGGMLLAAGFWGIAFPQYLFTGDCVKIVNKDGQDITGQAGEEKNLYCELGSAKPNQIEVKISILEWTKEKALKNPQKNLTDKERIYGGDGQ